MTRKEFLKDITALGIGLPFLGALLASCEDDPLLNPDFNIDFSGKVLIIGAGSAGLTAGYILNKYNVDFQIIEAAAVFGGRMKRSDDFTTVPIDLGAEWIHTDPDILSNIVNNSDLSVDIDLVRYRPQTHATWEDGQYKKRNFARHFYAEYKFKSTTWYGFFEKFIVPDIADKIVYNTPINSVNYSGDKVVVRTANNEIYEADKILMTVSTSILKSDMITFTPSLPTEKTQALDRAYMPDGIKVFMEFSERFYPDLLSIGGLIGENAQERLFYDAMFRKEVSNHILALFNVGESAGEYTNLATEDEIINKVLSQLDEIFDGKASETYQSHIIQNWSKEPYVLGSYTYFTSDDEATVEALAASIDDKVYFAGEATVYESGSTVHGAAESAYETIQTMF
ncbi:MAG: flavin monoamine oxidase family protein [Saprospiraceae bacterium]